METKYLDDYVDYMGSLYPEIERASIKEMMQDSFEHARRTLRKPRKIRIIRKIKTALFGEGYSGAIKLTTIYSGAQARKMKWYFDKQRAREKEQQDGKDNDK